MMKMTKTERELLTEAAKNRDGRVYAQTWWVTHTKGGIRGTRRADALRKLVEKGLMGGFRSESSMQCGNVNTTHATDRVATITEAGRKALES